MPPGNVLIGEEKEWGQREGYAEEHKVQESEEHTKRKRADEAAFTALRLVFELSDLTPGWADAAATLLIIRHGLHCFCDGWLDRRDG